MKKLFILIIFCGCTQISFGQSNYFVEAKHGLSIQASPNINAKEIGKLPYGSIVEIIGKYKLEELSKRENYKGKEVFITWQKIKFNNYPYKISNATKHYLKLEGYVMRNGLRPLGSVSINLVEIDKKKFLTLFKDEKYESPKKITSLNKIKRKLGKKVSWTTIPYLGYTIDKIYLNNGEVLSLNHENSDLHLVAYYPKEKIVLFEGGHSSDFSINIQTGEITETTGNPEYIIYSPQKKYRLNGWFPGQNCSNYFFQEKAKDKYKYLTDFDWATSKYDKEVCHFSLFQWLNDGDFIYSQTVYNEMGKPVEKYFQGSIYR